MNNKMPRTPFSTPLSGSARETEDRIRSILSGPRRRPPVPFLALVFAACLLCGNLVSCQSAPPAEPDAPARLSGASQPEDSPAARVVPADPGNPPRSEEEEWLLQALFLAADGAQPFQQPSAARLLASIPGEDRVLGAAFVEDHLENTLLLGVMDRESHELTGPVFRYAMKNAVPNVAAFRSYEGVDCLLYTFNGQLMGQYRGQAGVVRLDGGDLAWEWPVQGDLRDPDSPLRREYEDYCLSHLALMAPGGVDIYTVNPEFAWGKEDPWSMWQLDSDQLFYDDPGSAAQLPMPVYFQSLRWLTQHTGDPGGWRVVSLTLNEERSDPESKQDCYTLRAREELGDGELTAELFFPYETQPAQPRSYDDLARGEVRQESAPPRVHPIQAQRGEGSPYE